MVAPLKLTNVRVFPEEDRVHVQFGNAIARFPYAGALRVAVRTRIFAKAALAYLNEPHGTWRDIVGGQSIGDVATQARPDGKPSEARRKVGVWNEGPIVVWDLAGTQIRMEADTALTLHQWMINSVKEARAWAGDDSKQMVCLANLTAAQR